MVVYHVYIHVTVYIAYFDVFQKYILSEMTK